MVLEYMCLIPVRIKGRRHKVSFISVACGMLSFPTKDRTTALGSESRVLTLGSPGNAHEAPLWSTKKHTYANELQAELATVFYGSQCLLSGMTTEKLRLFTLEYLADSFSKTRALQMTQW